LAAKIQGKINKWEL